MGILWCKWIYQSNVVRQQKHDLVLHNVAKKVKFRLIIGVNNIIITDSIDLINIFMFQNFAGHVFALPGQQYHIVRFSITITSMVSTCCVIIWHYTEKCILSNHKLKKKLNRNHWSHGKVCLEYHSSGWTALIIFWRTSFNCYRTAGTGYASDSFKQRSVENLSTIA